MKRLLFGSAAVLALAGYAPAQQFQRVQIQPSAPVQPGKPVDNKEFKPTEGSVADPKSLDVGESESLKAKDLVRQLNSASYKEREAATREIAKMGRFAVPALKDALANESSPEVRLRIDLVMPKAEAEDMKARVSCFLLDTEGKFDHQLPGWTKFKTVLGNDKSTRELFAEVLKNTTYHGLLLACDLPANELGGVLGSHYLAIQLQQQTGRGGPIKQPTTAEIAVLAFLEAMYTDKEMQITNNYVYTSAASYLYNAEIMAAMTPNRAPGKYGVVLKKIVVRWLDSRETGIGCQQAMQFATQWQMVDDVPRYASKVLASDSIGGNYWIKFQAMTTLGQHKDAKKYLGQFSKVFDDTSIIQQSFPNQPQASIQLGDFALGLAIKIAGQTPKDYGLEMVNTADSAKLQQNNYFFKDEKDNKAEDKRKAGVKKFKDWIEKQPKEEPKKIEPKKDEPKKDEPREAQPVPIPKK